MKRFVFIETLAGIIKDYTVGCHGVITFAGGITVDTRFEPCDNINVGMVESVDLRGGSSRLKYKVDLRGKYISIEVHDIDGVFLYRGFYYKTPEQIFRYAVE